MADFTVIVPAAGSSRRFRGFAERKPFVELKGVPVWKRAVSIFSQRKDVGRIVLVLPPEHQNEFLRRQSRQPDNIVTVGGGDSRAESVLNGLQAADLSLPYVAIHDAARPLVPPSVIDSVFEAARRHGAAVPGIPVTSTVKQVDEQNRITATVDRRLLRLAQTPQAFSLSVLQNAYHQAGKSAAEFTDDASVVEASGHPVVMTAGTPDNIKITTAADFRLAEMILEQGHC